MVFHLNWYGTSATGNSQTETIPFVAAITFKNMIRADIVISSQNVKLLVGEHRNALKAMCILLPFNEHVNLLVTV